MTQSKNSISSKQLMLFIIAAQVGLGIISLPSGLAQLTGHDGWMTILLTGLLALGLNTIIILLMKKYKSLSIVEILPHLFGRILGTIINIFLALYLAFASVLGISLFAIFVKLTLLPNTPSNILVIFTMLPAFYIILKGLKPVARLFSLSLVSYLSVLVYILLIAGELRPTYLLPVGASGIMPVLSSIPICYLGFIGFELSAFLYADVSDKKNVMKYTSFAMLFSIIFYIVVTVAITALFGENMLKELVIPLFSMTRVYNSPILERVDLYFTAAWYFALGCSASSFFSVGYYCFGRIFAIQNSKVLYYIYIVSVILLSFIWKDINTIIKLEEFLNYIGMGVSAFFIVCLLLSFFKKRGIETNE